MAKKSSAPVEVILVEPQKIEELKKRMGSGIVKKTVVPEMETYGRKFVEAISNVSPVRDGKFRQGFDAKVTQSGPNAGTLRVTWDSPERPKELLRWIVQGTGIRGPLHRMITPKKAPVMKWKDARGRWHAAKQTKGMKPNDIIGKAIRNTAQARELLAERVGKIVVERLIGKS